ncbi:MAG: transketolase alpha subunit [Candidatus Improbicoccus devescovinae]|nr:MAG: transketolase alpha subunit [Candidatus Improbicoccus devescovinae]
MELRQILVKNLKKIMQNDENIIIINADLAKPGGFDELIGLFPDRCINVGVAEQNMAGIAAGLSSYNMIPLIFSFSPFVTRRICDQIAVSICYAQQCVKIFGFDPGITAQSNGGTHMSFEDISIMRSFPNMIVFEPCDEFQFAAAIPELIYTKKSVYTRMFRKELPKIFNENYKFDFNRPDIIQSGSDVSMFCSGIMVSETLQAAKKLKLLGINAEIVNVHTIKPINIQKIVGSAQKTKKVVTIENHSIIGGLYSAISEILCEHCPTKARSIGVRDEFGQVGTLNSLKKIYSMTSDDILDCVVEFIEN